MIDAVLAAPISSATSFADAAATPLAAGTACLVLARLGLPPGSRLLVLGASGGVGLFLLQLAAAAKIMTIGAGRQVMHAQMSGSGATACIDYTREDVASRALALAGGPVDAIANLVGGRLAGRMSRAAVRWQIAAIATPELDLDLLLDANITFHGVLVQDDGDRTRALAALLDRRALRPVVSHVLPLAAAARHTGSWKAGMPAARSCSTSQAASQHARFRPWGGLSLLPQGPAAEAQIRGRHRRHRPRPRIHPSPCC